MAVVAALTARVCGANVLVFSLDKCVHVLYGVSKDTLWARQYGQEEESHVIIYEFGRLEMQP